MLTTSSHKGNANQNHTALLVGMKASRATLEKKIGGFLKI
jgi:hypothetical protein